MKDANKKRRESPAKNWMFEIVNATRYNKIMLLQLKYTYIIYKAIDSINGKYIKGYIQLKNKQRRGALMKYVNCNWTLAKGNIDEYIRDCKECRLHIQKGVPSKNRGRGPTGKSQSLKIARNEILKNCKYYNYQYITFGSIN
jgi:hypothetical protein